MNVLITGGAGYIGSHVNKYLTLKGINTVVIDNLLTGKKDAVKYGKLYVMDFADSSLEKILLDEKIDAVMHFAALADVGHSVLHPDVYYNDNVAKSIKLLDMMVRANVHHIVFSSSAAIFGTPQYLPIDEKHPYIPISPYGRTKLIFEQILLDYSEAYNIHFACMRYFNAAGCDIMGEIGEAFDPPHHIIPIILRSILNNNDFKVFGNDYNTKDGTCIRDYIHVMDLSEIHWRSLDYIINHDQNIYMNLGNNKGFSNLEIIAKIEEITQRKVKIRYVERRKGDPDVLIASNKNVKEFFNWEPQYSDINTIISSAWNWEINKKY